MTRKRICLAVIAVLLLVTYVPIEDYDDEAVVITRDEAGQWEYEGDRAFHVSAQLAQMNTSTHENTTVTSDPEAGAWRCERIWILNTSDSSITRAVGIALQQDLLQEAALNEVAYFGYDELPLDVRRPPDLYVLLRLEDAHSFVLPGYSRFGASLNIVAARRPDLAPDSLEHSDVAVTVKSEIECATSAFGFLTPSARRGGIADAVVDKLDLATQLAWADEHLPRHASPDLDWIEDRALPPTDLPPFGENATRLHLYSQGAWLRHEETLWQVEVHGDVNAWAKDYLGQLERQGWSTFDPRHPRELDSPQGTATKGARYLTLSSTTGPAMQFRIAMEIDLEKQELVPRPVGRPTDTRADATNTVLVSHETRYTGHQILRLFELNQDAWSDMIPHLSDRERRLLRGELEGATNPALQELAAALAQD